MTSDDKPVEKRRHGRHAFIPAGILIGLGVGILLNYPGPGVLIGLGLGFLASSFVHQEDAGPGEAAPACCGLKGRNWITLLVGIFMILVGVGLVWTPLPLWPYLVAAFFILLGIGFIVQGFGK
jgi:hypothetical protein